MRSDPTIPVPPMRLDRMMATVIMAIAVSAAPLVAGAQETVVVPDAPPAAAAVPETRDPETRVPQARDPETRASERRAPDAPVVVVPAQPVAPRQDLPRRAVPQQAAPSPLNGIVRELRNGPLLIHGNFCGIGNRRGTTPIDALDAACMRHDACTRTGKLPGCACNDRLRVEATLVARDPRTAPDVRVVATATATAMSVLICKTGGTLAVPILPAPR